MCVIAVPRGCRRDPLTLRFPWLVHIVHSIRHRPLRMLIPTWIRIAVRQAVAHFDHREHAAHFDVSEGTLPHHYRQRVLWAGHVTRLDMRLMLGHATLAHRHVTRQEFANL